MLTSRIKRKTNNLNKLKKKIEALGKKSIKSGLFADQGNHPTAGIPYTDLAYIHHFGSDMFPERDIRYDAVDQLSVYNFSPLLNRYFYKDLSLDSVLDTVAFRVEDISQSLFGVPSMNNPSNTEWWAEQKKGKNSPLVHYGHLRDAWHSRVVNEKIGIRNL